MADYSTFRLCVKGGKWSGRLFQDIRGEKRLIPAEHVCYRGDKRSLLYAMNLVIACDESRLLHAKNLGYCMQ